MGQIREKIHMKFMVVKPEENRGLGRSRRRCEDNIKMVFKLIGCEDVI
jgi:hypothetical protein